MKKCIARQYYLIASVSVMLLTGCEQLVPTGEALPAGSESELLRKNGNALIESGKQQEAIIVFDKLIAADPQNALAYNGKAVAFDYSGNHLAAQELYQTALSLSPDSIPIKNNLAMSLILNNQINQAIKLLEPLVKESTDKNPSSHIIRHNLALAYGISGQHDKATKLNLRDMSKKQAQENINFYKDFIARSSGKLKAGTSNKSITKNEQNIGFITAATEKKPAPKKIAKPLPSKAAAKPTKPVESKTDSMFMGEPVVYDYPK